MICCRGILQGQPWGQAGRGLGSRKEALFLVITGS